MIDTDDLAGSKNEDDLFDLYQVDNQGSESFTEYIIGMMNNYVEELKRLREEVKMLWHYADTEQMYNDGLLTVEGEMKKNNY